MVQSVSVRFIHSEQITNLKNESFQNKTLYSSSVEANDSSKVSSRVRCFFETYIHIINEPMLITKSNDNNPTNDLELLQHTYEWDVGGAFMVDQTDLILFYFTELFIFYIDS